MRIALASDAWPPQVNGVVRTLTNLCRMLERLGHEVLVIHPGRFRTVPCPGYPEIGIALRPGRETGRLLDGFQPQAIHIATEGPCGLAVRRYCHRRGLPFTSSYHTQFPEYLNLHLKVPCAPVYRYLRWFHRPAERTLVPTHGMRTQLEQRGFTALEIWGRGVDLKMFRPTPNGPLDRPRPIFLNVGRVSWEKNLDAFAALDLPGTKIIVGDGPARSTLQKRYPEVVFTGYLPDDELAQHYAAADVFVFPSRTDTFGNVMLEAMASGTPVAAYPVTGPIDVVQQGETGVLDDDLRGAALAALAHISPTACRRYAESLPWTRLVRQFVDLLKPVEHRCAGSGRRQTRR